MIDKFVINTFYFFGIMGKSCLRKAFANIPNNGGVFSDFDTDMVFLVKPKFLPKIHKNVIIVENIFIDQTKAFLPSINSFWRKTTKQFRSFAFNFF